MNRSAAGEPDCEGFVVAVPERDHAASAFAAEDVKRRTDHGAFDATARHRSCDLAGLAHCHGRAGFARRRPLSLYDACDCDPLACGSPAIDIVENFTHAVSPCRLAQLP